MSEWTLLFECCFIETEGDAAVVLESFEFEAESEEVGKEVLVTRSSSTSASLSSSASLEDDRDEEEADLEGWRCLWCLRSRWWCLREEEDAGRSSASILNEDVVLVNASDLEQVLSSDAPEEEDAGEAGSESKVGEEGGGITLENTVPRCLSNVHKGCRSRRAAGKKNKSM